MACEKCGGKVDEISKNTFFCRECGVRQTSLKLQKPTGLLNLIIIFNYVMMALFIFSGGQLLLYSSSLGIILFFMAGVVFWSNFGLKKLDPSRRIYPVILYALITVIPFIGIFGIYIIISPVYWLILTGLNLYVLYMHKPTVELFRQIK